MGTPRDLVFFVATRAEDVPAGATRFASVDGSVPGAALTWDHHVTGELVNLDALPEQVDASALDAVGTTLADTDAVASAVAVALGGAGALPPDVREVLLSASHWCDHLGPHPSVSAAQNERGRGLHHWTSRILRTGSGSGGEARSEGFSIAVRELLARVAAGAELPSEPPDPGGVARARALQDEGRIRTVAGVALVDLRGAPPLEPLLVYEIHRVPLAVTVDNHRRGGVKYTIGVNPLVPHPDDLGPALAALAALEHAHGPPALLPRPGPGSENWGGRATVFGSPWNYGSRLQPEEVARAVAAAMGL
jgi:hypothetical protein